MSKRYKARRRARYYEERDDVCWCGVHRPYFAPVHGTCGGLGSVECLCGGDICVCHNHGEVECFGCDDCREDFDCGDDDGEPDFTADDLEYEEEHK